MGARRNVTGRQGTERGQVEMRAIDKMCVGKKKRGCEREKVTCHTAHRKVLQFV